MISRDVEKISGWSLIIYSVLLLAFAILWQILLPITQKDHNFIAVVQHEQWTFVAMIGWMAGIAGILGITGAYFKQSDKAGTLGLIGFIFLFFGVVLHACTLAWEAVLWKLIASKAASTALLSRETFLYTDSMVQLFFSALFLFFLFGWLLFGIASFKAAVFPRYLSIMLIICGILFQMTPFLPGRFSIIGSIIYFPGCFLLGLNMIALKKNNH
jgi:hypothetical protein